MKIQTIELYQLDLPFAGGVYHRQAGANIAVLTPVIVLSRMMAQMAGVKARHSERLISRLTPVVAGGYRRNGSASWP